MRPTTNNPPAIFPLQEPMASHKPKLQPPPGAKIPQYFQAVSPPLSRTDFQIFFFPVGRPRPPPPPKTQPLQVWLQGEKEKRTRKMVGYSFFEGREDLSLKIPPPFLKDGPRPLARMAHAPEPAALVPLPPSLRHSPSFVTTPQSCPCPVLGVGDGRPIFIQCRCWGELFSP